ncbi:MAG TPA: PadR family transcriptional regulator [Acidimicrobiia bacterium]|nr:PadR family transcriptional regulator [Acidimicrobiia bacterium]
MPRRQRSNPLALAVLAVLSERPMHPYEMAATMRSRGHDESIRLNYGSLYSTVDGLTRRGLIAPVETERDGRRPERTVYAVTDDGRTEVTDWLAELLGTSTKEYPQFEAGLALMGVLPPDRVVALLRERADALDLESLRLESIVTAATDNGVPPVFLVEIDYERALVDADLAFTRRLADDLERAAIGGVDEWRSFHESGGVVPVGDPNQERSDVPSEAVVEAEEGVAR